ncbi:MAG: CDP-alcohol phosphatidyltransferase family protein [Verrucomicrobia bacterium]|nr:CDP-alcohol phosphatidyltransferase family protein [Verrucomicrobiota bacterium]NDE63677.1 phosphatidylcholine/phosphatidylserine synthase [Chlamydiota bacterium]
MKKPYVVPNIITALGLSIGLFVIFKTALYDFSVEPKTLLFKSAILILVAACVDVLDGFVARRLKGESLFGMNFDSLSDAITFGVAPSVLLIKTAMIEPKTPVYFLTFLASMLFSLCGVLRLVRFNVSSQDEARPQQKKIYTGLPIPAAALAAISMQLILKESVIQSAIGFEIGAILSSCGMIALSYLMISLRRFDSLKWMHKEQLDFNNLFFISLIVLTLLFGFMYYFEWFFVFVTWTYVISGVVRGITGWWISAEEQ